MFLAPEKGQQQCLTLNNRTGRRSAALLAAYCFAASRAAALLTVSLLPAVSLRHMPLLLVVSPLHVLQLLLFRAAKRLGRTRSTT
jgi:hypothetical protein